LIELKNVLNSKLKNWKMLPMNFQRGGLRRYLYKVLIWLVQYHLLTCASGPSRDEANVLVCQSDAQLPISLEMADHGRTGVRSWLKAQPWVVPKRAAKQTGL
jgi:hypothetical protein